MVRIYYYYHITFYGSLYAYVSYFFWRLQWSPAGIIFYLCVFYFSFYSIFLGLVHLDVALLGFGGGCLCDISKKRCFSAVGKKKGLGIGFWMDCVFLILYSFLMKIFIFNNYCLCDTLVVWVLFWKVRLFTISNL